jgi:DNA-binding LytR/AlgR family response regulator
LPLRTSRPIRRRYTLRRRRPIGLSALPKSSRHSRPLFEPLDNLLLFQSQLRYSKGREAANKALHYHQLSNTPLQTVPETQKSIFVKADYKLMQIDLDKILYIEGLKDYLKIYTEEQPQAIVSHITMKAMEEMLPSNRFLRVHRSFIVNQEKIKIVDRNRIVFGKVHIPISDSYKEAFQEFLDKRLI